MITNSVEWKLLEIKVEGIKPPEITTVIHQLPPLNKYVDVIILVETKNHLIQDLIPFIIFRDKIPTPYMLQKR